MDHHTKYYISLLSAFIRQQEPLQEQNIDWEQVFQLGNIHSVSGMIYFMAKGLPEKYRPNAPLLQTMKQDFTSTIVRAAAQDDEMNRVIDELCRAEIPHLICKGYAIKNNYPVQEMRTMGDIDILIQPRHREKTHTLLQELGYKAGHKTDEVWHYGKSRVYLEIHTQLISRNLIHKFDYTTYFCSVWNHAVMKPNGYTYELSVEYHLLYLLVHMAKHFYGYGCGIRMIMDVAMVMIRYEKEIDWDDVNKEIERLDLGLFALNIFSLCDRWFEASSPARPSAMEENLYEEISGYILSAGTFGFYDRDRLASRLRKVQGDMKATEEPALLKMYLRIVFPDYEYMSRVPYCLFLKNRPLLLPAAWIVRISRGLMSRTGITLGSFLGMKKNKKEFRKQVDLISKLGL